MALNQLQSASTFNPVAPTKMRMKSVKVAPYFDSGSVIRMAIIVTLHHGL